MMRDTGIRLKLTSINTRALIFTHGICSTVHREAARQMEAQGISKLKLRLRRPDIRRAAPTLFSRDGLVCQVVARSRFW